MAITVLNPQPQVQPVGGVLFDMDGVVLDTECLYSRFWQEACREHGFSMDREQSLQMRSLNREAGQKMLETICGPGAEYAAIRATRIARMEAFIRENGVRPKAGIRELLDHLEARGIPAAIASSSPPERIRAYLEPLGLYGRFRAICSGHEVKMGKPAPDIYLRAAELLDLPPQQCLAVEDSPAGITSAFRAGCLPVLIPDLDRPDDTIVPLLHAQADTLTDLICLIP